MRKVTKLLAALTLATGLMFGGAAVAAADNPGSPGNNCSQGNSNATCVPDPNEHGQECEDHGNAQGNENHCLTVTVSPTTTVPPTTTPPPSTTTVTVPTTTTATETETTSTSTTTTPPATTTTAPPSSSTTTTTPPVTSTTTAPPTTTTSDVPVMEPTKSNSNGPSNDGTTSEQPDKLAFTGVENVVPLGSIALGLLTGGSGLLWLGRKRDDE